MCEYDAMVERLSGEGGRIEEIRVKTGSLPLRPPRTSHEVTRD